MNAFVNLMAGNERQKPKIPQQPIFMPIANRQRMPVQPSIIEKPREEDEGEESQRKQAERPE